MKVLLPVPGEAPLVEQHLGLARRIAADAVARSAGGRADPMEALSGALMGLLEAVRTHDPDKGSLGKWIKKIVPRRIIDSVRQGNPCSRTGQKYRRLPPLPLDVKKLCGERYSIAPDVSLDATDHVAAILRRLPADRLRRLFALYHLRGRSMRQIGEAEGISECRVSQLLSKAAEILTGDREALANRKRRNKRKKTTPAG